MGKDIVMIRVLLTAALLIPAVLSANEPRELYIEVTDNIPKIGIETEVYLGDRMLIQRTGEWKECITPKKTYTEKTMGNVATYKAGEPVCKINPDDKYYHANYENVSNSRNSTSHPVGWKKDGKNTFKLCLCPMGCSYCIKKLSEDAVEQGETFIYSNNSMQQTIEYSGKQGDILTFTYSEFLEGFAREAFNREFTLDLNEGNVLAFKGAVIEVVNASNMNIRYKVIRNFQE